MIYFTSVQQASICSVLVVRPTSRNKNKPPPLPRGTQIPGQKLPHLNWEVENAVPCALFTWGSEARCSHLGDLRPTGLQGKFTKDGI